MKTKAVSRRRAPRCATAILLGAEACLRLDDQSSTQERITEKREVAAAAPGGWIMSVELVKYETDQNQCRYDGAVATTANNKASRKKVTSATSEIYPFKGVPFA